jgi:hypothetical protein
MLDTILYVASYPMGTRGSFPGDKAAKAWNWHSPTTTAEVKNTWIYTATPQYVFTA